MRKPSLVLLVPSALLAGGLLAAVATTPVAAHTETDVVAVAAGSQATVALRPTHGCGDSPTVDVAIRAPVADATAGAVEGWTATAVPDGPEHTVLTWTGGSLPATTTGEFPVEFAVPDAPGTLLTFPSVQICEDGSELAWINGDPTADNPAPRLLILPAGSEPAATIDDVAPDAPGRDQLTAIIDVDNPAGTTTTAAPTTTVAPATPTSAPVATDAPANDDDTVGNDDEDDGSVWLPIGVGAALMAAAGAGVFAVRRRSV